MESLSAIKQFLIFSQIALETLPISSSAHVLIIKKIFEKVIGKPILFGSQFYEMSNIPTLFLVLVYFKSELISILPNKKADFSLYNEKSKLLRISKLCLWALIANSITIFFYLTFRKTNFEITPTLLIICLTLSAIILGSLGLQTKGPSQKFNLGILGSVLMGLMQSISLLPGISRFAVTYTVSRWFGNSGKASIRFSFFLHSLLSGGLILKIIFLENKNIDIFQYLRLKPPIIPIATGLILSLIFLKFSDYMAKKDSLWKLSFYYIMPILTILLFFNFSL